MLPIIISIVGAAAVGFLTAALQTGEAKLWIGFGISAAVSALLLGLGGRKMKESEQSRPSHEVNVGGDVKGSVVAGQARDIYYGAPAAPPKEAKLLRDSIRIERDERPTREGHKTVAIRFVKTISPAIESCKVRLERLELWDRERGAWTTREWFSPRLLAWSFNDRITPEERAVASLPAGIDTNRSCDLAVNEGDPNRSFIVAAQDRLVHESFLIPGRWRCECWLEADGYDAQRFEGVFLFESAPPGPSSLPNVLTFEELSWDGVGRFNELIEAVDFLVQEIFERQSVSADSIERLARWGQSAERLIERHGSSSQLTDFRTATENEQDFGKGRLLPDNAWNLVRKANAQKRVLSRCRDSLRAN